MSLKIDTILKKKLRTSSLSDTKEYSAETDVVCLNFLFLLWLYLHFLFLSLPNTNNFLALSVVTFDNEKLPLRSCVKGCKEAKE